LPIDKLIKRANVVAPC